MHLLNSFLILKPSKSKPLGSGRGVPSSFFQKHSMICVLPVPTPQKLTLGLQWREFTENFLAGVWAPNPPLPEPPLGTMEEADDPRIPLPFSYTAQAVRHWVGPTKRSSQAWAAEVTVGQGLIKKYSASSGPTTEESSYRIERMELIKAWCSLDIRRMVATFFHWPSH